jgi:predicted AAA+ superfamily ATPase
MEYLRDLERFAETSFLFGPRGTGKSTWLRRAFPEAVIVDLLDSETFRYYSAMPERIGQTLAEHPGTSCFIVDEVQKAPELLPNIHRLIEAHKSIQFILTGSSSRKLKKKGVDLLAGRALNKHFHPLTAHEMGDDFDLDRALTIGMVPLIVTSSTPEKTQRSYIDLYLNEEVKEEGLTRNVGDFARFLEAVAFSQGSVLNASEVARDSAVKRTTVDSYLSILEDLLIAVRIPVFARRAKRAVIRSGKFYFFDCGLFAGMRPKGPLDDAFSLQGVALETLVMQHLRAWIEYAASDVKLYFWRTRGGSEVDFVLYGHETFLAIEVKNTRQPRARDLSGLKTFHHDYPEAQPLLLYRGSERKQRDGIPWIPVDEFLRAITPGTPLADLVE